ncbi:MAG: tyrosine-type recombinase/integrase [Bacteroidales bacterium]|nr:tyrosine-type recombinase/integrase [Bacteroidales bacterium]
MEFYNYINFLIKEKHYSQHTVTAYTIDLKQFDDFIQRVFEKSEAKDVNAYMIRDWIIYLHENNIANRSINRKIVSLRSYFHFLIKNEEVSVNPLSKILSLKNSKRNPVYVMEEDMNRIINMDFEDSFNGIRDKLIIELLYATGMRKSELLNLEEKDFDLTKGEIRVFGKRRKERIIPIHNKLIDIIRQYTLKKNTLFLEDKIFFINEDKSPISISQLDTIVKKYLSMAQVERKSAHVLRHTFATHLLNEGADILDVKELLGHQSLEATQIYTHNTIERLKNVYKQTHPRSE